MFKRIFVISDLQVPYHDQAAVDAVAQCISDYKNPEDRVLTIGDEMDFQTISRWVVGGEKEWERSMGRDRDATVQVLRDLQVTDTIRSNHTDRLFSKLAGSAPGFLGLPELELPNFLKFDELGITFHSKGFEFAKDWIALHGDETGTSQLAGRTAANLAAKVGKSVVCGHTHRMGMAGATTGIYGHISRTLWGVEVGNLMDATSSGAAYSRIHNWQQGWAVMHIEDGLVTPTLMPIENQSFVFEGTRYSW